MNDKQEILDQEIDNFSEEELRKLPLNPLADPVVAAMFTNEDVAGLAAQSLVNAVLEMDGDPPMSKIIRLSSQKVIAYATIDRGYRLDIEGLSEKKLSDTEIQLTQLKMNDRAFLYAGQLAAINAKRGQTMPNLLKEMPRILMININWFDVRKDHPDFTQPVDLMYRKPDPESNVYSPASDRVHIYNVSVTKFKHNILPGLKGKPYDPKAPRLYYWLWALAESHSARISLSEVIQMNAALQEFIKDDKGFEQYKERYEEVSDDLTVRRQFAIWTAEMNKIDLAEARGREEGEAKGRAEGEREKAIDAARKLLSLGIDPAIIAQAEGLPLVEVLELGRAV